MTLEERLYHELEALDKYELIALLIDYVYEDFASLDVLANYVDNWSRHS